MRIYIYRSRGKPRVYGATRYETASNLPTERCPGGWEFYERVDLTNHGTLRFAVDTGTVRRQVRDKGWFVWAENDRNPLRSQEEQNRVLPREQSPSRWSLPPESIPERMNFRSPEPEEIAEPDVVPEPTVTKYVPSPSESPELETTSQASTATQRDTEPQYVVEPKAKPVREQSERKPDRVTERPVSPWEKTRPVRPAAPSFETTLAAKSPTLPSEPRRVSPPVTAPPPVPKMEPNRPATAHPPATKVAPKPPAPEPLAVETLKRESPNPQGHHQVVWFDIPVQDIDRAVRFYSAVLGVDLKKEQAGPGAAIAVLPHPEGMIGGCLVQNMDARPSDSGPLLYLNTNGRLDEAIKVVGHHGGKVLAARHSIAPFGFRAVVLDSEGNRVALHSM